MEYVKPFLIGGAVIGGSKAASKLMGPALAPLVGGMPTGIIASFFLKGDDKKRKYFEGYASSSFTLFLAILFIHLATMHFQKVSVNIISGISYIYIPYNKEYVQYNWEKSMYNMRYIIYLLRISFG